MVRAPLHPAPTQVPELARGGRSVSPNPGSLVRGKGEPLDPGQDRRQQNLVSLFPPSLELVIGGAARSQSMSALISS